MSSATTFIIVASPYLREQRSSDAKAEAVHIYRYFAMKYSGRHCARNIKAQTLKGGDSKRA